MKKLCLTFALVLIFTVTACGGNSNNRSSNNGGNNVTNNSTDVKIKLIFNSEEITVKMYDNPSSRDFIKQLPLTLTFEDYAKTEKISKLAKRLSTEGAPSGTDPSVGDFTYYSPWGNLAIFYQDSGYANGLVKLGHFESGIEKLAKISGNFIVTIEQIH